MKVGAEFARFATSGQRRARTEEVREACHPGQKSAPTRQNANAGRTGAKTEVVLALLRREGGVGSKELMKATGWLPHSARGFLSGTVGKKMGLAVVSSKGEDGGRNYSIES